LHCPAAGDARGSAGDARGSAGDARVAICLEPVAQGQVLQPGVSELQPPSGEVESQPDVQVNVLHAASMPQLMSHAHDGPQSRLRHDS
jgi:hypothetical protein